MFKMKENQMDEAHKKLLADVDDIKKAVKELHEKMSKVIDHIKHCEEHEKSGKCEAHKK